MSEEKKNFELKDEELEKVSGGGGYNVGPVHVVCPCGCNKKYWVSVMVPPLSGEVLGTCDNGWKATFMGGISVEFYEEKTNQKITKSLSSTS